MSLTKTAIHITDSSSTVGDYVALLKPRVMSLVVFCGAVGMWLAPGTLHPLLQIVTILCIAIATGASGAINMWYDRDMDAMMERTRTRPIPAGRVKPEDALAFGVVLCTASVFFIGLAVNWVASSLLCLAIAFYVGVYTIWLKRRSVHNIVIGGASGALPPMIGWAAVTGDVSWNAFFLFLIIFLWTPAHFWALALYRNKDYAKAGVPMLPVVAGEAVTKKHIAAYTVAVVISSMLPFFSGLLSLQYGVAAALLGAGFIWHMVRLYRGGAKEAMQMFGFSLFYLFILFAAMPIDRWLANA